MIWSPSTTLPSASTARQRSASPSCAMPTSAPCSSTAACSVSRWVEPTPSLMLRPSGSAPMTVTRAPASRERLGRDAGCRAVRAVEHDVEAVEAVRQRAEQVHDVAVLGVGEPADAADAGAGRAAASARPSARLDAVLDHVGELGAADGEELDAVVGRRVVRRRDHHAEVGARCRRSRNAAAGVGMHAGVEHVDAGAREPGRDGGGEELARDARVARDDGRRAAAGGARASAWRPLPRTTAAAWARPQGEVGGEVAVGQPPDPVRAEEPRHAARAGARISASRTADALRAFLRPAFLRSMTRASRVRKPAFLRVGAVVLAVDLVQRTGDGEAQRAGLARGAATGDLARSRRSAE